MKSVRIRDANFIYLITLVLVVALGSWMQVQSFTWGLIGTEVLCILLPALVLLWIKKTPFAESVRLRWPGWKIALLSVLMGAGIWMVDALIDGIMPLLTGYSLPTDPSVLPQNTLQAVLTFLALAVFAPLCEEILFRGVIFRAYRGRGVRFAIFFTGFMFVFYHMRLQGMPALIPIALLLGFVYERTDSLVAAMLVHFGNNLFAAILLITASLYPNVTLPFPSLPFAALGLVVVIAGIFALRKLAPARVEETEPAVAEPGEKRGVWALVLAGGIYVVMAGLEVILGVAPQLIYGSGPLTLSDPAYTEPQTWNYTAYNQIGDAVGTLQCKLTPQADLYQLNCAADQEAYEIQYGGGTWSTSAYRIEFNADWSAPDMLLNSYAYAHIVDQYGFQARMQAQDGALHMEMSSEDGLTDSLDASSTAFTEWELPFRLSAMEFSAGKISTLSYVWPLHYDTETQTNHSMVVDETVTVRGSEPLQTENGVVWAWKVTVGDNYTFWYSVDAPHTLLQIDDHFQIYKLVE